MIGRTISHYEILEKLGEGGMGVVYKARDTRLDRLVALKVLPPDKTADQARKRRFVQEARSASALNHPNIITIYDIDSADGVDFIAMEYVAGKTLDELILHKPMPVDEALARAVQIADALAKAHGAGIIHRDLKPANVMVSDDGLVKVLDFGLAKLTEQSTDATLTMETAPDAVIGTPAYMSPEQIERRKLDTRSDIFSFGAVLYEMLSGRRAFQGPSAIAVMSAILREEPRPLGPELPAELAALLTRCLSKDPDARFQQTTELKKALEELQRPARDPIESLPSIAVLPFLNMNRDEENEFFADGLTEELINALTQLQGLRVVSRTSVFHFKGATQDIREVGRKLQAKTALEGSVRRAGNRVRITAQLINVADGYHLWSQRYDREMKDIFDVQDELARAIVETLEVKLVGKQKERLVQARAMSPKAHELLMKGRYYCYQFTREGFRKAAEYLEDARIEDPGNAQIHAWAAFAHSTPAVFGWVPPREAMPEAKRDALRALELDDTLADAHHSLATARHWYEWDWEGAEREYQRAIELKPGDPAFFTTYAEMLADIGRFDESIAMARQAVALDPVSTDCHRILAEVLFFARRYDDAIEQCHRTLELNPRYWFAHFFLALSQAYTGQLEEALKAVDRMRSLAPGEPFCEGVAGSILARAGKRDEAATIAADLIERRSGTYFPAMPISWIYNALGETDQVFRWFDIAYEERDPMLCGLNSTPSFDPLRSDPRFTALLKKMGLEP